MVSKIQSSERVVEIVPATVVEIVPVLVVEIVPAAVVEIVPADVVEMVPALVVEIVPVVANAFTETSKLRMTAPIVELSFFMFSPSW